MSSDAFWTVENDTSALNTNYNADTSIVAYWAIIVALNTTIPDNITMEMGSMGQIAAVKDTGATDTWTITASVTVSSGTAVLTKDEAEAKYQGNITYVKEANKAEQTFELKSDGADGNPHVLIRKAKPLWPTVGTTGLSKDYTTMYATVTENYTVTPDWAHFTNDAAITDCVLLNFQMKELWYCMTSATANSNWEGTGKQTDDTASFTKKSDVWQGDFVFQGDDSTEVKFTLVFDAGTTYALLKGTIPSNGTNEGSGGGTNEGIGGGEGTTEAAPTTMNHNHTHMHAGAAMTSSNMAAVMVTMVTIGVNALCGD